MQFVMYIGKLHIYQHSFFITYDIYISKHAFSITILQNNVQMCKKLQLLGDFVPQTPAGALPLDPTGGLPSPNLLIGQCLF